MRSLSLVEVGLTLRPTEAAGKTAELGSVTAEFAAVVPAVLVVLACCLGGLQLAAQQLRIQDAASVAARSAARGGEVAIGSLVDGATFTKQRRGNVVCVTVKKASHLFGSAFGQITLEASGCALSSD